MLASTAAEETRTADLQDLTGGPVSRPDLAGHSLVQARLQERARLQRELHDGLGPLLSAISLQAGAARLMADDPQRSDLLLRRIEADARTALAELRAVLEELRPPELLGQGLVAALRGHAERSGSGAEPAIGSGTGPRVEVRAPEPLGALPPRVELAAYRIAREAVHNAQRHSGGTLIVVELCRSDERLILTVTDDGQGTLPGAPAGLGLRSMRERAAEMGGALTVTAHPGAGVAVRAVLPLQPRPVSSP